MPEYVYWHYMPSSGNVCLRSTICAISEAKQKVANQHGTAAHFRAFKVLYASKVLGRANAALAKRNWRVSGNVFKIPDKNFKRLNRILKKVCATANAEDAEVAEDEDNNDGDDGDDDGDGDDGDDGDGGDAMDLDDGDDGGDGGDDGGDDRDVGGNEDDEDGSSGDDSGSDASSSSSSARSSAGARIGRADNLAGDDAADEQNEGSDNDTPEVDIQDTRYINGKNTTSLPRPTNGAPVLTTKDTSKKGTQWLTGRNGPASRLRSYGPCALKNR